MMVSFVLSFFPRDVLDEILNLIESVSEDFPSYSSHIVVTAEPVSMRAVHFCPLIKIKDSLIEPIILDMRGSLVLELLDSTAESLFCSATETRPSLKDLNFRLLSCQSQMKT